MKSSTQSILAPQILSSCFITFLGDVRVSWGSLGLSSDLLRPPCLLTSLELFPSFIEALFWQSWDLTFKITLAQKMKDLEDLFWAFLGFLSWALLDSLRALFSFSYGCSGRFRNYLSALFGLLGAFLGHSSNSDWGFLWASLRI